MLREESSLRSLGLFEIESRLEESSLVESMTNKLDGMIAKLVSGDKNANLLDTLPGLAPYTAFFLSSHVGDINRFVDSRHMCAVSRSRTDGVSDG